ncbi:MAG: nucleotidyltransferase domain-containing protein [Candidatus Nanoarchaeia archaeon]|nr:nucleotidyltransferase domain-containing protein [Candidatus Nanoarchaeia archaeon]
MELFKHKFTRLQSEIFSLLCMKAGSELNKSEIASILKVSPTAVAKALSLLEKDELVTIRKEKNIKLSRVSLNRDNKKAIELKRAENLKNIYSSGLTDYLEKELAGGTAILFGSYSRGEDTDKSDIDIAVVGRKDKMLKLEGYENKLSRKININFYSSWKDIHKYLKNNILNGILIQGGVEL